MRELGTRGRRPIAALGGLAPFPCDRATAPSAVGAPRAQSPCCVAIQHNPTIKAFYERLRANGKP